MSISIQSNGKNETPRTAPSAPNSFMWNHKRGSSSAAARLIVMVIYWRLYSSCWLQNTLCVHRRYSPRVVGGKNRTHWKPFVSFHYLFLHTVYKNSKPNQGRGSMARARCRGSDDNTLTPPPPHMARPLGSLATWRALTSITEAGLWLHSLPAVLFPTGTQPDKTFLNKLPNYAHNVPPQPPPTPLPRRSCVSKRYSDSLIK